MKIALCFSGQPRYIEESYEQFSKGLFEKNDVDVFAHFWWDESYKGKPFVWESSDRYPEDYDPLEVFSKKFKPKWTFVEAHKPKEFFGYSDFPGNCVFEPNMESDFARSIITRQRSQWYSIFWSMSHPNLEDYDMIIRARTDLEFERPLDLSEYDPGKVYMMNGALQCGGDRYYQDWFWFGPYKSMMKINKTYDKILPFYKNGLRHMHELMEHSIVTSGVDGEIQDLGVYMRKKKGISSHQQQKIVRSKNEDLQVDLV